MFQLNSIPTKIYIWHSENYTENFIVHNDNIVNKKQQHCIRCKSNSTIKYPKRNLLATEKCKLSQCRNQCLDVVYILMQNTK